MFKLYPIEIIDLKRLKLEKGTQIRAIKTNEFRQPFKGEWFISGSPAMAYKAPNNLSTLYYIAQLVIVKREIKETIIGKYIE